MGGLSQVAQTAISTVEESTKAVGSLRVLVVDSAKKNVDSLVNQTTADIWKAVNNSAIGTAIPIEQCVEKGIQTVVGHTMNTGKCIFLKFIYPLK